MLNAHNQESRGKFISSKDLLFSFSFINKLCTILIFTQQRTVLHCVCTSPRGGGCGRYLFRKAWCCSGVRSESKKKSFTKTKMFTQENLQILLKHCLIYLCFIIAVLSYTPYACSFSLKDRKDIIKPWIVIIDIKLYKHNFFSPIFPPIISRVLPPPPSKNIFCSCLPTKFQVLCVRVTIILVRRVLNKHRLENPFAKSNDEQFFFPFFSSFKTFPLCDWNLMKLNYAFNIGEVKSVLRRRQKCEF